MGLAEGPPTFLLGPRGSIPSSDSAQAEQRIGQVRGTREEGQGRVKRPTADVLTGSACLLSCIRLGLRGKTSCSGPGRCWLPLILEALCSCTPGCVRWDGLSEGQESGLQPGQASACQSRRLESLGLLGAVGGSALALTLHPMQSGGGPAFWRSAQKETRRLFPAQALCAAAL